MLSIPSLGKPSSFDGPKADEPARGEETAKGQERAETGIKQGLHREQGVWGMQSLIWLPWTFSLLVFECQAAWSLLKQLSPWTYCGAGILPSTSVHIPINPPATL